MSCDEAQTLLLRDLGGDAADPDARAHLSACAPCDEYRRDAERLWQMTGRVVETCPIRRNLLHARPPRRSTPITAAAALALIAGSAIVAWAVWPAPSATPAQDRSAEAEELLKKDPELRKQVLRTAVEEKERLAEFEKKIIVAEADYAKANTLYLAKQFKESAELTGKTLAAFPHLVLVVLDPSAPEYRSQMLLLSLRVLDLTLQLALLKEKPEPGDAGGEAERAQVEISLHNRLREIRRQQQELLARGPQPRKKAAVELGGAEKNLRQQALDKIRSIRITVDMQNSPLSEFLKYLIEISSLPMVLEGSKEARETPVTIQLSDTTLDAVLEHSARLAGYTWEVDRFGILVLRPAKK